MSDKEPENEESRTADADPHVLFHVTWESPAFGTSGYAVSSRASLRGLKEAGVKLRLIPMEHENRETVES